MGDVSFTITCGFIFVSSEYKWTDGFKNYNTADLVYAATAIGKLTPPAHRNIVITTTAVNC